MDENITSGDATVEGIPVSWAAPSTGATGTALWLTHLGGSAEQAAPVLTRLAERGLLAVSFDPPGQGAAATGRAHARVCCSTCAANQSVKQEKLTTGTPTAVLAGIDRRISRVGAVAATPDWTRPGMRTLGELPEVIDQGQADGYARWFFEALNPMTHLEAYERDVAVRFLCAGEDQHVPPDGALRFRAALIERDPRAADHIDVKLYDGLSHIDGASDQLSAGRSGPSPGSPMQPRYRRDRDQ